MPRCFITDEWAWHVFPAKKCFSEERQLVLPRDWDDTTYICDFIKTAAESPEKTIIIMLGFHGQLNAPTDTFSCILSTCMSKLGPKRFSFIVPPIDPSVPRSEAKYYFRFRQRILAFCRRKGIPTSFDPPTDGPMLKMRHIYNAQRLHTMTRRMINEFDRSLRIDDAPN